jgi:heterodisulfide reductase subunit D
MYLLKALLNGDIELSEEIKERFYSCSTCGRCSRTCQTDLELVEIWEEVRTLLVEEKLGPLKVHKGLADAIAEHHNPFRDPAANRGNWLDGAKQSKQGEIAFFAGCTASIKMNFLARNTLRILQAMGKKVAILGEDEWCCGSVLLRTGQRDHIKTLVDHNVAALKYTGADTVITSCTGCFKTISIDYPQFYGKELPFKVMHITQYLAEQIRQGHLKFTKALDATVTYHDPCHLGLHAGEYDAPREIIKAIPGVNFVEMENVREHSKCCGAGGGLKAGYPDMALAIAKVRAAEAVATGAIILASCCPFCKVNLTEAIKADNLPLVQRDITELVLGAMEIE